MTPAELTAIASAIAAAVGAWLEITHRRHERELAEFRERLRAVEVRCERLEAAP